MCVYEELKKEQSSFNDCENEKLFEDSLNISVSVKCLSFIFTRFTSSFCVLPLLCFPKERECRERYVHDADVVGKREMVESERMRIMFEDNELDIK